MKPQMAKLKAQTVTVLTALEIAAQWQLATQSRKELDVSGIFSALALPWR